MLKLLIIILLSGVGAVIRDLITIYMPKSLYGTLIVNIIGAFLAGTIIHMQFFNGDYYDLMMVGFLGGFTTYSAFTKDQYELFKEKQYIKLILYTLIMFSLTLIAFYVGYHLKL